MKKYGNEFKVGVFFLVAVLGLAFLTFRTGKINFHKKGYNVYVVFEDIAGLDLKAPVLLNGYEVGEVEAIEVVFEDGQTNIILTLLIEDGIKILSEPQVSIKTLGLMGEKFIQISSYQGDDFIEPGSILKGQPYIDMDVLIANVNSLTDEVKNLTGRLGGIVSDNQDSIGEMIKNLEAASKNMEEFTEDIKAHPWKLLFKK